MGDPLEGVNAIFYMSVATLLCGSIALCYRMCYKSKCSEIKICGCIKITRDVEIEKEEDMMQPPSPKTFNI